MKLRIDWGAVRESWQLTTKNIKSLEKALDVKFPKEKAVAAEVTLVSPKVMRQTNRTYAGHDAVTDVLSFAERDAQPFPSEADDSIGQVLICAPCVAKNAQHRGINVHEEMLRVLVHGILHCLGFDHIRPKDALKMMPLQEQLVYEALL